MIDSRPTEEATVQGTEETANELNAQLDSEPLPQRTVESFETANGSVYSYDDAGKTTRFKTATGEQHETQDVTVFARLTHIESQKVLRAYRKEFKKKDDDRGVDIVQDTPDDGVEIVRFLDDITDPSKLFIGVHVDGQLIAKYPASLSPELGDSVYDTRAFQIGQQWHIERHLGNEVTKIHYKE